jgi:hypothetical protein
MTCRNNAGYWVAACFLSPGFDMYCTVVLLHSVLVSDEVQKNLEMYEHTDTVAPTGTLISVFLFRSFCFCLLDGVEEQG